MTIKRLLALIALAWLPVALHAQGNTVTTHGIGAPSGGCAFVRLYVDDSTGTLYNCKLGAWNSVGGGGAASMAIGGTVTSATPGSVFFAGAGPVLAQDNANLFWGHALAPSRDIFWVGPRTGISVSPNGKSAVTSLNEMSDFSEAFAAFAEDNNGASAGGFSAAFFQATTNHASGAGVLDHLYGIDATANNTSSNALGVVTSMAAYHAQGVYSTGITTNGYGLLIDDQIGATTNYAAKFGLGLFEHDDADVTIYDNAKSGFGSAINGENDCTIATNVNCSGVEGDAIVKGAGKNFTNVVGVIGTVSTTANSTTATFAGVEAVPNTGLSGGTATNNYGFWCNGNSRIAGTTDNACVKIADQTAGAYSLEAGVGAFSLDNGNFAYTNPGSNGLLTLPSVFGTTLGHFNAVQVGTNGIPSSTQLTFKGATSGGATLGVPSVAGTPNEIDLPTTTGTAGYFLVTDGASPQQSSWSKTLPVGTISPTLASIDLTGQTAAKTATNLYMPTATGMYRISYYAKVTTVGSVSSILGGTSGLVIAYTDGTDSVAQTAFTVPEDNQAGNALSVGSGNTTNTNQAVLQGSATIFAKTGVQMTYAFGYTSVNAAEMTYELHIRVEGM